jgi:hypothetical protein
MNTLQRIFSYVFECHHRELSRVFTIEKRTYQVCFTCGRELNYSWELMQSRKSNSAALSAGGLGGTPEAQRPEGVEQIRRSVDAAFGTHDC